MPLRLKTLLIVGATMACLIGGLYAISRVIVLESFSQLEVEDVEQDVERALSALSDSIARLESTAGDWGAWDETWLFVQGANPEYVEDNLQDSTLSNLGLNVMVFVDTAGSVVHSKAVDLQAEQEMPTPQGLLDQIHTSTLLTYHEDTESRTSGVILLPEGPMLVVSYPILTNEDEGPIAGALIIGRFLDSDEIDRLAEVTHLSITTYRLDDPALPPELEAASVSLSTERPILIQPLDGDTVAGYTTIEDITGTPVVLLRVETPRGIYQQGVSSNHYFMLSLAGVGIVLAALTLLLLERLVLSRLTRLSRGVEAVGASGDMSARVTIDGTDELSRLGKNINDMLSALQRSAAEQKRMEQQLLLTGRLAAVGELAAGVAHELNNPLAAVQAYAQLLNERQDLDESVKTDLQTIHTEAQRASRITGNLLSFARQYKPERTLISINDMLQQALELDAYHLKVSGIEVVTQFDPDLPKTLADPHQMQQVFVNLITNAEQAITEARGKGTLRVRTSRVAAEIHISFQDNGPGIPDENLTRLFDPFFTTKTVGKGTGLGLSICYGIVKEHGGRLHAESELGKGTTFVVELPIVSEDRGEKEPVSPLGSRA